MGWRVCREENLWEIGNKLRVVEEEEMKAKPRKWFIFIINFMKRESLVEKGVEGSRGKFKAGKIVARL